MEDRGSPLSSRKSSVERSTRETRITVELNLDGSGQSSVATPLPFLTHMVEQVAHHGSIDLRVSAQGDVEVDGHHTTEDLGLVLGKAVLDAIGPMQGIRRYGSATLPMDDALVIAAIDLSGRPHFGWQVPLPKAKIGCWDAELTPVFFEAFARGCQATLHFCRLSGDNLHHLVECAFKAFARALRDAVELDVRVRGTPSTKGLIV